MAAQTLRSEIKQALEMLKCVINLSHGAVGEKELVSAKTAISARASILINLIEKANGKYANLILDCESAIDRATRYATAIN